MRPREKDGDDAAQRNCDFWPTSSIFSPSPNFSPSLKLFGNSRRIDAGGMAELLSSDGVGKQISGAMFALAEDINRDKQHSQLVENRPSLDAIANASPRPQSRRGLLPASPPPYRWRCHYGRAVITPTTPHHRRIWPHPE
jgi:hypothetical protein